jgi:hypothetical protein
VGRIARLGRRALALPAMAGVLLAAASLAASGSPLGPSDSIAATRACGTTQLYGKTLRLAWRGDVHSCPRARELADGKCRVRVHHRWSCFSFRPPDPLLVWFPSDEMFNTSWSSVLVAHRYPCRDARVTSREWQLPRRGFPTRRQVLADDLVRCDLLKGHTEDRVRSLLGPPDQAHTGPSVRHLDYDIGRERDSFFQIDDEYLSVRFTGTGDFKSVGYYQG